MENQRIEPHLNAVTQSSEKIKSNPNIYAVVSAIAQFIEQADISANTANLPKSGGIRKDVNDYGHQQ